MELFGVGGNEVLVILLIAAVVLGPERLAKTARELGKLYKNFKNYMASLSDELKTELDFLDDLQDTKKNLTGKR